MFVIGTAGHIDHGKTLLIRALTGIDCDRLPEEKEREMTIDLGFAHMEVPGHGRAGVIDVPGHERFIRNMVAGAWGMDIGLLVVAADDGWMPQTSDHFRVLRILAVPRIIAVINKCDLADDGRIDALAATIHGTMASAGYEGADIVRVSAKTGAGIDALKAAIARNCGLLPPPADQGKPYLFADRAFAVKGHGTVVTGTQKNGTFREGDTVTVLPGEREARLKRVESHHLPGAGETSARTALNITGLSLDDVPRGSIVVRNNYFTRTDDFIAAMTGIEESDGKKPTGIEVLAGTADIPGRLSGVIHAAGDRPVVRIRLDRPWYLYPGQRFVVTKTGGYRIYAGGVVLLPRYDRDSMRGPVAERSGNLTGLSREEIFSFIIAVHGWLPFDTLAAMFPYNRETIESMVLGLVDKKEAVAEDAIVVRSDLLARSLDGLRESIEKNPGLHLKELSDRSGIDAGLCAVLARRLVREGVATEREGRFFPGGKGNEPSLGKAARRILEQAAERGRDGLDLGAAGKGEEKKLMKELIGMGLLVSIDGNLLWHRDVYDDMKRRITELFGTRDKITVGDARDATGLSRKFLIPLLNRMERDGAVKRSGDFRVKP